MKKINHLSQIQRTKVLNMFVEEKMSIEEIATVLLNSHSNTIYSIPNGKRVVNEVLNEYFIRTRKDQDEIFNKLEEEKAVLDKFLLKTCDNEVTEEVLFGIPLPNEWKI